MASARRDAPSRGRIVITSQRRRTAGPIGTLERPFESATEDERVDDFLGQPEDERMAAEETATDLAEDDAGAIGGPDGAPDSAPETDGEAIVFGYWNPDGTYHYVADGTDRDPITGAIVRFSPDAAGNLGAVDSAGREDVMWEGTAP